MQRIDSSDNKKIKRLTSLKQKKVRLKENLFLMEGLKSVDEAISENALIDMILVSDHFMETNPEYCSRLEKTEYPLYITRDYNLEKCSNLKTPQGILAAVTIPDYTLVSILEQEKPIVILDGISDPGNLGTVIRAADAFGFGGVILLPGCTDPFSPKTVQSTMGSIIRVKCIDIDTGELDELDKNDYYIYGMDLSGTDMDDEKFSASKTAVIIGSESHGLSRDVIVKCSKLLKISMPGNAESLNASVAAGIVMHKMAVEIRGF